MLTPDPAYPRHRLPQTPLTPDTAKCHIFYANRVFYIFQKKSGTKLSMETHAAIFCLTFFSDVNTYVFFNRYEERPEYEKK